MCSAHTDSPQVTAAASPRLRDGVTGATSRTALISRANGLMEGLPSGSANGYRTVSPADVKKAVLDCTVDADEFYLVFSGVVSKGHRETPGLGHTGQARARSTTSRPASASSRPASASSPGDPGDDRTILCSLMAGEEAMTVYARPGAEGSLMSFQPRYDNYLGRGAGR